MAFPHPKSKDKYRHEDKPSNGAEFGICQTELGDGNVRTQASVGCPTTPFCMRYGAALIRISTTNALMDERIHFIYHKGKKILLVDLSKCPASELEKLVRQVPDHVTVQPLGSVLVLTDFTGAVFDRAAVLAVKETAVFDKPYIKKSALVGTESFPKDFYEELKSFSRRDLLIFGSRDEALAWLVADSNQQALG
jgi:hypothetical protein